MISLFNAKAALRVLVIVFIALMVSPTANPRAWPWQCVKRACDSISFIFSKKGTFKEFFKKNDTFSETFWGKKTPLLPPLLRRAWIETQNISAVEYFVDWITLADNGGTEGGDGGTGWSDWDIRGLHSAALQQKKLQNLRPAASKVIILRLSIIKIAKLLWTSKVINQKTLISEKGVIIILF